MSEKFIPTPEEEVCANCIHCHKTKKINSKMVGLVTKNGWEEEYICTLWLDTGETHEPLLLTLGDTVNRPKLDLCECIELKEKKNE